MKKLIIMALPLWMALTSQNALAGKVEDVQAAVKKSCSKDVASDEALRMVKNLYLSCTPGSTVELDGGCKVPCLKDNAGAVIGQ